MSFAAALNSKDFVVTAHLNLADVPDKAALQRCADVLAPSVDAIQLPDSTQLHMSGIAAAAILLQKGIEPVVHLNCRDRNRIALRKDVAGVAALGGHSILIMRGRKIPDDQQKGVRAVFDIPALEFISQIDAMKHDEDKALDTNFLVGATAEIFDPHPEWTPRNLIKKCDAGANFIQTQLCFDTDIARNYMAQIVAARLTYKARFLLALAPLPSAKVARWAQENVNGAIVPDSVVDRLERAADPAQEGVAICAELMQEMTSIPGVSGVNLVNFGEPANIPAAVAAAGLGEAASHSDD